MALSLDLPILENSDEDEDDCLHKTDHVVLKSEDIEGEEEDTSGLENETQMTAFNLREEFEEGHFDTDGNYYWNKEKVIRDNWLDEIDWNQVAKNTKGKSWKKLKTLGESSDSEDDEINSFSESDTYEKILGFMKPKESISKTLQRLGKCSQKLTTLQRIKLKKQGISAPITNEQVAQLTELCHKTLTLVGNMDIYEITYEQLQDKINKLKNQASTSKKPKLDMFSENFNVDEQVRLEVSCKDDDFMKENSATEKNACMK